MDCTAEALWRLYRKCDGILSSTAWERSTRKRVTMRGINVGVCPRTKVITRSSSPCDFSFVRDFSTSPASLNGLATMGVEDACARETRVATKAYDLWIATGNPDKKCNWYRAVRRMGLHVPGVPADSCFDIPKPLRVLLPRGRTSSQHHRFMACEEVERELATGGTPTAGSGQDAPTRCCGDSRCDVQVQS